MINFQIHKEFDHTNIIVEYIIRPYPYSQGRWKLLLHQFWERDTFLDYYYIETVIYT